jgi:2'-5' RNA ligase
MFIFINMKLTRFLLREALLKEENKRNKYGCVMVYFDYDQKDWDNVQNVIEEEDLYDPKDDPSFGKEDNPHATILFGLHTDIEDEKIIEKIKGLKKPKIKIGKISSFKGDEYDVLKFDLESEDLIKANKIFVKFPHTTDFPNYHPHTTIAYVKTGKAEKYIKELNMINTIKFTVSKFVYSKADGTKKHVKIKED